MVYFLGIDLGGTVNKAGIYDTKGNEISICEHKAKLIASHEGFAERDMLDLYNSVCMVIKGAIAKANIKSDDILGVSFSSHGKGLYTIDKDGKPVINGILSSDTRSLDIVKHWIESGTADKAYPMGMQQIWTGHPVSILRWLYENDKEAYDKIDTIFMVHDYIRYMLTSVRAVEITNISGSNLYNINTSKFDTKLAHIFGVDDCVEKMPDIIGSTDLCGYITKKAAIDTNLKEGTKVFGGFFDVVAASIATGVIDDTALSATAGTWSIATTVHKNIKKAQHNYIWGNYCIKDLYFVHEGSPTSASNLEWWRNGILKDIDLDTCNAYVAEHIEKMENTSLFYYPYLFGSNFKLGQNASLYGLQAHHTQKDIIYALYEGIVFSHLINQDKITKISDNIKTIKMAGGPTKSIPWMQMFASASDLEVEISPVSQIGCKAAAICAAVGSGFFKDFKEALSQTHQKGTIIEPNCKLHKYLRERYEKFLEINKSL